MDAFILLAWTVTRVLSARQAARKEQERIALVCESTAPAARVSELWIYPVKSMRGHSVPAAEIDAAGFVFDRRYMVIDASNRFVTQRGVPALATITPHVEVPSQTLPDGADSSPAVVCSATATQQTLVLTVEPLPANAFASNAPLRVPLVTQTDLEAPGRSPPGACVRSVVVWDSTVTGVVDQGDAAAAWLCAVLGAPGLRLVYFDAAAAAAEEEEGARCSRAVTSSQAPSQGSGYSGQVSFADGFPLLVLGEASVAALNARLPPGAPRIPFTRFRTNVLVSGAPAFAEDQWRTAALGPSRILLRGCKLCDRCRVTTTDQRLGVPGDPPAGALEAEPLATLRTFRRATPAPAAAAAPAAAGGEEEGASSASVFMGLNVSPQWDSGGGVGLRWRPRGSRVLRAGDPVYVLECRPIAPGLVGGAAPPASAGSG